MRGKGHIVHKHRIILEVLSRVLKMLALAGGDQKLFLPTNTFGEPMRDEFGRSFVL